MILDQPSVPKLVYTMPANKEGSKSVRFCHTGTTTATVSLWLLKAGVTLPADMDTQTGDEVLSKFPIPPQGINEAMLYLQAGERIVAAVSDLTVSVVVFGPEAFSTSA